MPEYSNETLTALLAEIRIEIQKGFDGVHARQDKTNGNVIRNREDIDYLRRWKSYLTGAFVIISAVLGFLADKIF